MSRIDVTKPLEAWVNTEWQPVTFFANDEINAHVYFRWPSGMIDYRSDAATARIRNASAEPRTIWVNEYLIWGSDQLMSYGHPSRKDAIIAAAAITPIRTAVLFREVI